MFLALGLKTKTVSVIHAAWESKRKAMALPFRSDTNIFCHRTRSGIGNAFGWLIANNHFGMNNFCCTFYIKRKGDGGARRNLDILTLDFNLTESLLIFCIDGAMVKHKGALTRGARGHLAWVGWAIVEARKTDTPIFGADLKTSIAEEVRLWTA